MALFLYYHYSMQIFNELNKNPNLSLALGFFDGVHLGHRAVIESAVDFAKQNNTKSAVITFKDHPCCFLKGISPKYILTRKERQEKFEELGIDFLYELDFESIAGLTAEDYLKSVLVNNFMPSAIFTGWNHNFGYKKSGDTKFLRENSKKYGYEYFELSPQKIGNEIISSTAIRKYLQTGKTEKANEMLGYNFSITGEVVKGNQIGRKIGFKTANIDYPAELIELPFGVYATIVKKSGKSNFQLSTFNFQQNSACYNAIANYGMRPTVNGNKPVLEVHILDFDEDIYGETITAEFNRMLRPEKKFNSLNELKEQINKDIQSL